MSTTIRGIYGHTVEARLFSRGGAGDCLSLAIYDPQGGFRASVDLSPEAAAELGSAITGYPADIDYYEQGGQEYFVDPAGHHVPASEQLAHEDCY